ncbi:MAG: hypothetical protein J5736_05800 [Bacilli bacterium]|nr:hypothetical protein [Bacilli bacterium]
MRKVWNQEVYDACWTPENWSDLMAYLSGDHSAFSKSRIRQKSEIDPQKQKEVIDFIFETLGLSFSAALLKMIDRRGMSDTQVYKAAKVDRRLFSKIRSNDAYQPSKKTAIRLCLALRTDLSEALALLEKAGFCLSRSKRDDLVVQYCLQHQIFDVEEVNLALLKLNLEGLY